MQLVDNLNKISIGKIHGAKKDITIGDYAKLKQSNFITSFFLKIQLGLEGKGWWITENDVHELVKDMSWEKIHGISVYAEDILGNHDAKKTEVEKHEIQAVHTLFYNETKTRREPLEAKFVTLQKSNLSDFYAFDNNISTKLVDDYINFFLLENEDNITITSSMQIAKKYLVDEMVIKNNQKDYRSPHDFYVPKLEINGFIDYLVQKQLNDKLSAAEQETINTILKFAEKGPKYFFFLNRSREFTKAEDP